jgi:hypothetical protein
MSNDYGKTSARGRALFVVLALVAGTIGVSPAFADHGTVGLAGSIFEIDEDANLVTDHAGSIDWATADLDFDVQVDLATGTGDDSFGQGSKEDTAVPSVVSGSIPPNKSDLKSFGIFQEKNTSGEFLHMFWTRVQDPSGTTNMDFEFNQSKVISANGVTPVRTNGDLLITYDLSRGGTVPTLSLREWNGSAWGPSEPLSEAGVAAGSINTTAITEGASVVTGDDELDSLSPRTFGEATIDLSVILGDPGSCTSFGSVYLKSRSSDSFTSALKDFIAPMSVNISNCGSVTVKKVTVPANSGGDFGFTTTLQTDGPTGPVDATIIDLAHDETDTISNVVPGTDLTITETQKTGYILTDVTCTTADGTEVGTWDPDDEDHPTRVTFDVNDLDQVTCVFTNTGLGSITIRKQTVGGFGEFTITDVDEVSGGSSFDITTSQGTNPAAHTAFSNLVAGTYNFSETAPLGWVLTDISCTGDTDDGTAYGGTGSFTAGDTAVAVDLDPGEAIVCTFTNTKPGRIDITKTDDAGNALAGVGFTLWIDTDPDDTDTEHDPSSDTVTSFTCTTDATGTCSIENVAFGDYWVVESTPPSSSTYSGTADQKVNVSAGADLDLTFVNPRLHKVIVLVCHAGTDTLVASDVTYGSNGEITTLGAGDVSTELEAALCALAGIAGLDHGELGLTVDVGTTGNTEHD